MIRTHNTGDYWVPQDTKYPVAAAGALFRNRSKPCTEEDVQLTPSQTYGVVTQENYMELSGNRVVLNTMGASNMKRVRPGDFIIHLRSFQGGIELSRIAGKVSNAYTVLEPSPLVDIEYFRWLLKSDVFINGLSSLTDQLRDGQSISFGTFSKLAFPLPPLETQRRIADYLDRETGQIDETITRIDKVIDLLEERKSSVIDDAFKGIPMTTIQTGWEVIDCRHFTAEFVSEGTNYVVSIRQLDDVEVDTSTALLTTDQDWLELRSGGRVPEPGDAVMSRNASPGKTSIVTERTPEFAIGQDVVLLKPRRRSEARMLRYSVYSPRGQADLELAMIGSTFKRINVATIKRLPWVGVAADVQEKIADRLDTETSQIDTMVTKARRVKSLLQERRSALITATVTGKVEV